MIPRPPPSDPVSPPSPDSVVPYSRPEEQQRLFALYHGLQGRLHCAVRPLRLLYRVTARETLLAWVRGAPKWGGRGV